MLLSCWLCCVQEEEAAERSKVDRHDLLLKRLRELQETA